MIRYLATIISGWIGILLFLVIALTFKTMTKNNEYALLHLFMAIMYAMWFPLPTSFVSIIDSRCFTSGYDVWNRLFSIVSDDYGTTNRAYCFSAFIVKHNEDSAISNQHGNYMMATLSKPFESLLGMFKCIWIIFLGVAFWQNDEIVMASLMFVFSLMIFYYLLILLNTSLVKRIKVFSKVNSAPLFINIVTILLSWY